MYTIKRLRELLIERGWSEYRLMKESGLAQSTISNIFRRNSIPSIPTLEAICKALGITLSQFFAEGEFAFLSPDQLKLIYFWSSLSGEQKKLIFLIMQQMKK